MSASKTFDTDQFEFAHGHKPRGYGRWAFATRTAERAARGTGQLPEGIEWRDGTYTEAKAQLPAGEWIVLS